MAAIVTATSSLTRVRFEAMCKVIGAPPPDNWNPPLVSLSRPSWVVRTESNVRKECLTKPDPPCVVCKGSGRVDCHNCNGRGRTNNVELTMLPKGEWPKWCRSCGGSGLGYCDRCLGTGEYRYIMGFQFMKKDSDEDKQRYQVRNQQADHSFTERLLNDDCEVKRYPLDQKS